MSGLVIATAPGSVMITGEHAVVYGHPALVAAIDQRVSVTGVHRTDGQLRITSEIAKDALYDLADLPKDGPYRFIVAAVAKYAADLAGGVSIDVKSQINPTLGLGSSAAVTVATLGVLAHTTGGTRDTIHADALSIVRNIQGRGSGADLAASLTGGCLAYQIPQNGQPAQITPVFTPPALGLKYTGYKTPTGEVLAKVAASRLGREELVDALYAEMGANASATIAAVQRDAWHNAGPLMNAYQALMGTLGVSDDTIDAIIAEALTTPGLMACKISGSGLGDCVLSMGARPEGFTPAPLAIEGLRIHD
ncbi:MAG: hypothetical protein MK098_07285 [Marinovum sp.]|nr:hypothetical protein [Marinovum sp.]